MIKLRDYQQDFVSRVYGAWEKHRVLCAVLPTGGGKTVCFASVIHDHDGACAAVVHRQEIVGQISKALGRLDVRHRVIAPANVIRLIRRQHLSEFGRSYVDDNAQAGVISVQTLTSRSAGNNRVLQAWVRRVTLAVFDEGHHYVDSGQWAAAVHAFDRAKIMQVTATPERADGKGLGVHSDGFCETMIEGPTTRWLIDSGYLSPFKYLAPSTDLDVRDVAVTKSGDFNAKALRARVVESHLVGDTVSHYRKFADGKRAIVFATDVATAHELADAFNAAGYRSAALSGKTEAKERETAINRFTSGELQILVNVDLFDEGFDVPSVEVVVLARPTQSLGKFLQMVGRGLRIMDGKEQAIIIDPVRNWERHGLPDWPRNWSLDGREKRSRGSSDDTIPQRVCLGCTQPYPAFNKTCPYCGFAPEPAARRKPEQVDGDLFELDADALAALFAKMQQADMSDGQFIADMRARRVPQIGHGRQLKAHRIGRHRRQVLRELVGWWVGAQETDREMSEIHRRFYHRFGLDIATAFTLKASDTDNLIEVIKTKFHLDAVAGQGHTERIKTTETDK